MTEVEFDIESDLSVFHRIDDVSGLGSRRWARLVPRLPAYSGAVQARIQQLSNPTSSDEPVAGGGVAVPAPIPRAESVTLSTPHTGGKEVEATPVALKFSDIGDMFSFSSV